MCFLEKLYLMKIEAGKDKEKKRKRLIVWGEKCIRGEAQSVSSQGFREQAFLQKILFPSNRMNTDPSYVPQRPKFQNPLVDR